MDDGTKNRRQHGCLVSGLLLPWLMAKLVFFILPKAFLKLPRAVARSVSSQSTSASAGATLPSGVGGLRPPEPAAERDAMIEAIRAHDPGFVAADLAQRAVAVHDLVGRSLHEGDAAAARLVMADGLWNTHRMLLSLRSDSGVRREASVAVSRSEIVDAFHSTLVDEVRVRLTCEGACCDVHGGTGLVLRGSRSSIRWQEDLTFTRSAQAVSPPGGGVLVRSCPNCGAALQVTDDGACTTCHAVVMSGRHDWVLTGTGRDPW